VRSTRCARCQRAVVAVDLAPEGAELVEPIPDRDGDVCARPFGDRLIGWVVTADRPPQPMHRIYMRHSAMCPLAPRQPRQRPAEPPPSLFDESEV
jgi:hypothetical protein